MRNLIGITCIPDLLRGVRSFPGAFMDLVREPIRQGTGLEIGHPPGGKRPHGLRAGFDLTEFRDRAGMYSAIFADQNARQAQWTATYHRLPASAIDYLFEHLPTGHLLLSFEAPHWLARACTERSVDFLDLRPSPLRFGRDLYIALRCTDETLSNRIGAHRVCEEELRLEAAVLGANVRMHGARLEDERGFTFEKLDDALMFVGQAPYDASLLAPDGRSLRCTDFADELRELCRGRRLLHKPHPFALEFAHEERTALERITGQMPQPCQQNAYQILSSEDDVVLVGISSGMLQEASWFDKTAHLLYQPFVPLVASDAAATPGAYQQIHFQTLLSPAFWHQVLAPERPAPRLARLPPVAHNHARETFDHWWDYSKVMTWERAFPYESFMRGGGAILRQRIDDLDLAIGNHPKNLHISSDPENEINIHPSAQVNGLIKISGKNNKVHIGNGTFLNGILEISGDGNLFKIDNYSRIKGKFFLEGTNGVISINRNTSFEDVQIICAENCNVNIGKDCMFSRRIEIRTTDAHSLVNLENGQRTNPASNIEIGNHVWIGTDCLILKNTKIADNCVIGARSIVNKAFDSEGSLIAGSPARVVREKITWQRERKKYFTKDEISSWQGPGVDEVPSWR